MKEFEKLKLLKYKERLVDNEQLRSIINNKNIPKKFNLLKGFIMGLSIGAVIVSAFLMFSPSDATQNRSEDNDKTLVQDNIIIDNQQDIAETKATIIKKVENENVAVKEEKNEKSEINNITLKKVGTIEETKIQDGILEIQMKHDPYPEMPNSFIDITIEEAKNIGIDISGKCIFTTEEISRIHPIDYKRDNYYRTRSDVQELVNKDYDTSGVEFLITKEYYIELKSKKFKKYLDSIKRTDHISYSYSLYQDTSQKYFLIDTMERTSKWNISNLKLPYQLMNYDGRNINQYNRISPVWFSVKYRGFVPKNNIIFAPASYRFYKEKNVISNLPSIDEVIPIRVKLPDDYIAEELVFYFLPTIEFLEALPGKISSQLINELKLIDLINKGVPADEVCKGVSEDTYFNICSLHSGELAINKIYPNPTQSSSNLEFKLSENRKISLKIYDESGNEVLEIFDDLAYDKGTYKVNINVSTLSAGMYSAVITTDQYEKCSIRLIKI